MPTYASRAWTQLLGGFRICKFDECVEISRTAHSISALARDMCVTRARSIRACMCVHVYAHACICRHTPHICVHLSYVCVHLSLARLCVSLSRMCASLS